MKKVVSSVMLALILIGTLTMAFSIQPVKTTNGTIYIRADGSVDPPTAPIRRDGNLYTFTSDIYDFIVVKRDNIVIDGAGYTLQGTGAYKSKGIDLSGRTNVTVRNTQIKNFYYGIYLNSSSHNNISGNNIINNDNGVYLDGSSNNIVSGNNITKNGKYGVALYYISNYNIVSGNNIIYNDYGVWLKSSSNNRFYHNNFIDNCVQVNSSWSINVWDDGYPSGGNYWSDYSGVDLYSGPYQNITGSDSIGDTPYVIDVRNADRYPLIPEFSQALILSLFMVLSTLLTAITKRRFPIKPKDDC